MVEKHRKLSEIPQKKANKVRNENLTNQVTQWKASPIDYLKRRKTIRDGKQG